MSQLVDRDASRIRLEANNTQARLTYTKNGRQRRVTVKGAINARPPTANEQVEFELNYHGRFFDGDTASIYKGPSAKDGVGNIAAAATAPDGSHWVAQTWRRMQPNYGIRAGNALQRARELHVSHFTGPLPLLEAYPTWAPMYAKAFHRILGRLTYQGHPVYGHTVTRHGAPRDDFARNVRLSVKGAPRDYVRYREGGRVWSRENGFLSHKRSGVFCYVMMGRSHSGHAGGGKDETIPASAGVRGPANGTLYLLQVGGPGVTPIVSLWLNGLPDYNPHDSEHLARARKGADLLAKWYRDAGEDPGRGKCQPLLQ